MYNSVVRNDFPSHFPPYDTNSSMNHRHMILLPNMCFLNHTDDVTYYNLIELCYETFANYFLG